MAAVEEEIREINQVKPDAATWANTIIDGGADLLKISAVFVAILIILSNTYPSPDEQGEDELERLSPRSWQVILAFFLAGIIMPGAAYAKTLINTSGQSSQNTSPSRPVAEERTFEVAVDVEAATPLIASHSSSTESTNRELTIRDKGLLLLSYSGETLNMAGGFLLTLDYLYSEIYSEKLNKTTDIIFLLFSLITSGIATYALTRTAANKLDSEGHEEEATEDKTSKADWLTNFRAVAHFLSDLLPSTVFFATLFSLAEKTTDLDDNSTGELDHFKLFSLPTYFGVGLAFFTTLANVAGDWFINWRGQNKTQSTRPQNIQEPSPESYANSTSERSAAYVCALTLLLGLSYFSELSETAGIYWVIADDLRDLIAPHWNMSLTVSLVWMLLTTILGALNALAPTRTAKINIEKTLESSPPSTPSCSTGWCSWFSSTPSSEALTSDNPSNQAAQTSYAGSCLSWLSATASSTSSYLSSAWRRYTVEKSNSSEAAHLVP